jgi:hypothetical protein
MLTIADFLINPRPGKTGCRCSYSVDLKRIVAGLKIAQARKSINYFTTCARTKKPN